MKSMPIMEAQERFLAEHEAANHSLKHVSHYRTPFANLNRFIELTKRCKTVATITTETMQALVVWLRETPFSKPYRGTTRHSIVGIHGHCKGLRAWVRWMVEAEGIVEQRVRVPLPKLPRRFYPILTREELATLYQSPMLAGKGEANLRNRAIFALLLDTDIRLAECATLRPDDIKYGTLLHVVGKGDKERAVSVSPQVVELLARWLVVREKLEPGPDDTLFLLTGHGIGQMMERLADKTGIVIFPHKVRHTACTRTLLRGMELYSV